MIVVIPMAGRGTRFQGEGYDRPKPLLDIEGKLMLWHAFQSLRDVTYTKLVFIALREHEVQYKLSTLIRDQITPSFELVLLDAVTPGQLCTVLAAAPYFRSGEGLLIAASDTYVKSDIGNDIRRESRHWDGIISVVNLPGDQWSFARTNEAGDVVEVSEKVRISDYASTGLYYFSDSGYFHELAAAMVAGNERTRGEFYVMPLYNKYLQAGRKLRLSHASEMWDMGTPEAKVRFEQHLRLMNSLK